jgi:hypothetical protein
VVLFCTILGSFPLGVEIVSRNATARTAFRFMNLAVAKAARRRTAGASGDPAALPPPAWRPFQLAFILLNIAGLVDRTHPDREVADLQFFPTGGGKSEGQNRRRRRWRIGLPGACEHW